MGHIHSVYDTDLHFIVDPITRQITSESGKVTLMQGDHNSERFTFEIPRYIEGHDMSICDIAEVHYNNTSSGSDGAYNSDVYPIGDLQISPDSNDIVIGSWLVSQNATMYNGSLSFILRFACTVNTKIEYQWFSDICTGISIAKNMYNADTVVADWDNTDVLARWREEVFAMVKADILETKTELQDFVNTASEQFNVRVSEVTDFINNAEESFRSELIEAKDDINRLIAESNLAINQHIFEVKTEVDEITTEVRESATNAQIAADRASASNTAAYESEVNAATSANAAAQSALAAATSSNTASSSASKALDSELSAKESETVAEQSAMESKSYAVGGTNTRANEDVDNAKHYSEVARSLTTEALDTLSDIDASFAEISKKVSDTYFGVNFQTGNLEYTSQNYNFTINPETGNLEWEVV